MLENKAQTAVEIRNHCELKVRLQLLQHATNLRVKLPNPCFSKVFIGDFEEIVPIEFAQGRRDLLEDTIHELAPPVLVVVLTRSIDRGALRHLFPGGVKCALQILRIQIQADFAADIGVMTAYSVR